MQTKDLEQLLGLTKHTIHYYEKEGLISPVKDPNGYRNYSDTDLQTLQFVKYLRSLDISIDDVKGILNGNVSFQECLKVNQIHLEQQMENMKELKEMVDQHVKRELPLIPALANIEFKEPVLSFGYNKTSPAISLGRKLTRSLALRQLCYSMILSFFITLPIYYYFLGYFNHSLFHSFIISFLLFLGFNFIILAGSFKVMGAWMMENSMNQSVEFLENGIQYYEHHGFMDHFRYFLAVLRKKEKQFLHTYPYEEITEVQVITKQRYMKANGPLAYPIWSVDFRFQFQDGKSFYFFWPMTLNEESRVIACILECKIPNIIDEKNVLYAFKNSIPLQDYLANKA